MLVASLVDPAHWSRKVFRKARLMHRTANSGELRLGGFLRATLCCTEAEEKPGAEQLQQLVKLTILRPEDSGTKNRQGPQRWCSALASERQTSDGDDNNKQMLNGAWRKPDAAEAVGSGQCWRPTEANLGQTIQSAGPEPTATD